MKTFDHELVVCIVNSGFSEAVMDAARSVGAKGGTVITAKGTANKEAETFFKIFIQPEKEMVMILVPSKIKEQLLHALYKSVGLDTPGQGIAFALPVDHVVGLASNENHAQVDAEPEAEEKTEENKQA
ncbi:MAG: P-II family nitrogen regulator [Clostridia bacterium]|nr:P-II family nitrogen regulator [Clostridia bacterium]